MSLCGHGDSSPSLWGNECVPVGTPMLPYGVMGTAALPYGDMGTLTSSYGDMGTAALPYGDNIFLWGHKDSSPSYGDTNTSLWGQ